MNVVACSISLVKEISLFSKISVSLIHSKKFDQNCKQILNDHYHQILVKIKVLLMIMIVKILNDHDYRNTCGRIVCRQLVYLENTCWS